MPSVRIAARIPPDERRKIRRQGTAQFPPIEYPGASLLSNKVGALLAGMAYFSDP